MRSRRGNLASKVSNGCGGRGEAGLKSYPHGKPKLTVDVLRNYTTFTLSDLRDLLDKDLSVARLRGS